MLHIQQLFSDFSARMQVLKRANNQKKYYFVIFYVNNFVAEIATTMIESRALSSRHPTFQRSCSWR